MNRITRAALLALLFAFLSPAAALAAEADELPDKVTLSANRMRFDSNTGDFLADGNVTIKAGELTITAPHGSGNVETQEVLFDQGIAANGIWMGDAVDVKAGRLALSFGDAPTCRFQAGIKGDVGAMRIDADTLTLIGKGGILEPTAKDHQTKFWVVKARRLEDRSQGITLGADSMEGLLIGGELHTMTAKSGVWVRGRPKGQTEAVSLKGNHALYSVDRGSVVMSGNVSAVQGGRTLKSESIVYFPDQNRVEAIGGVRRDGAETTTNRAEITIDLSRERKPEPPKANPPKPAPKKRGSRK